MTPTQKWGYEDGLAGIEPRSRNRFYREGYAAGQKDRGVAAANGATDMDRDMPR